MPEPKGIDHFFKKRTRPGGCAMALLKYAHLGLFDVHLGDAV